MEKLTIEKRFWILDKAQNHFFESLLLGYASTRKSIKPKNVKEFKTIKTKNRTKNVTCFYDGFKIVDEWITTPFSNYSSGTTTTYYKNNPVWWMEYHGRYNKKVIKFLKKCLEKSYKKHDFAEGRGRGPSSVKNKLYTYWNNATGNFENFNGDEVIVINEDTCITLGYHKYSGQALI